MTLDKESLQMIAQIIAENNARLKEELRAEFNLSFDRLEHSIAQLDSRLSHVENDVHDIKLELENDVQPHIKLLAGGVCSQSKGIPGLSG